MYVYELQSQTWSAMRILYVYLAIIALAGVVLQDAISADAVLCAQLLPELAANLVAALPYLQRDDLSWHWLTACAGM
jgi:hypothetical protein